MLEVVAGLIGMAAATTAGAAGYVKSKGFVARRLKYVDSVQTPAAPLVAAAAAMAVAAPVVWVLPIVGAGTAIVFGVAVGAGTRSGIRQIRRMLSPGF